MRGSICINHKEMNRVGIQMTPRSTLFTSKCVRWQIYWLDITFIKRCIQDVCLYIFFYEIGWSHPLHIPFRLAKPQFKCILFSVERFYIFSKRSNSIVKKKKKCKEAECCVANPSCHSFLCKINRPWTIPGQKGIWKKGGVFEKRGLPLYLWVGGTAQLHWSRAIAANYPMAFRNLCFVISLMENVLRLRGGRCMVPLNSPWCIH